MPVDPNMPDTVSVSPQQMAATNQIAQNVANQSGAPTPQPTQAPSGGGMGAGIGNFLNAFAVNLAHGNYIQDQLRSKYQQDLMDKEMQFKLSTAKKQAELATWDALVQQGGSKVFNSPEAQKYFHKDPDLYNAYKQMATVSDNQKALTAAALQAAGMSPTLANLPPSAAKMIEQEKALQQKTQSEAMRNAVTMRGQDMAMARTDKELAVRMFGIQEADKRALKSGKQFDASTWLGRLSTSQQNLLKTYDPTASKYDDKAAVAAAQAHNAFVDRIAKAMKEKGVDFDPTGLKVQVTGWDKDKKKNINPLEGVPGFRKQAPVQIVPETPNADAAVATGTPTPTGPEAAAQSIRRPPNVPADAVYGTYKGKAGWKFAAPDGHTKFIPS